MRLFLSLFVLMFVVFRELAGVLRIGKGQIGGLGNTGILRYHGKNNTLNWNSFETRCSSHIYKVVITNNSPVSPVSLELRTQDVESFQVVILVTWERVLKCEVGVAANMSCKRKAMESSSFLVGSHNR